MNTLPGIRYAGGTASGHPVTLVNDGPDIAVVSDEPTLRFPRASIVLDAAVPGVSRRLRLPDGSIVETDPAIAVSAWWPAERSVDAFAFALERRWLSTLLLGVLGALVVWYSIVDVLPRAAGPVARHVSPRAEAAIGQRTLATLDRLIARPTRLPDDERARVAALLAGFMEGEPERDTYRLEFRRMGAPNAFALPGNIVVVTDELVRSIGGDDELLAVLGHEIGHLRAHHAIRLVLQRSGVAVLATVLAGDAAGMTVLAAALPSMLLNARYSREFEAEADASAVAQLARHGRSPAAFADALERLSEQRGTRSGPFARYFGSHPVTAERIERAREAARGREPKPAS